MRDIHIMRLFVLVTWMLCLQVLYPLPQHKVDILKQQYNESFDAIILLEKQGSNNEIALDEEKIKAEYLDYPIIRIWVGWITTFVVIVFGILTGFYAVYQLKFWKKFALLLSSFWLIWIIANIGSNTYIYASTFDKPIFEAFKFVVTLKINTLPIVNGLYPKILYIQKEFLFPILHLIIFISLSKRVKGAA